MSRPDYARLLPRLSLDSRPIRRSIRRIRAAVAERPGEAFESARAGDGYRRHLAELPDGSGCAEIWDHLSESRADGGRDGRATESLD